MDALPDQRSSNDDGLGTIILYAWGCGWCFFFGGLWVNSSDENTGRGRVEGGAVRNRSTVGCLFCTILQKAL